jgi:hypothetical protein
MTSNEIAGLIFGSVACSVTVGTVIWRIITLKLNSEVLLLKHNLERKDLQISNLQDVQTLSHKGLEEKFGHFSTRTRAEVKELDGRTRQIENFLSKNSKFEART